MHFISIRLLQALIHLTQTRLEKLQAVKLILRALLSAAELKIHTESISSGLEK